MKVNGSEHSAKYEVIPQMAHFSLLVETLNDAVWSQENKNSHWPSIYWIVNSMAHVFLVLYMMCIA